MNSSQEVFDQLYALKQAKIAFREARTARLKEYDQRTCMTQVHGAERDQCGTCHLCLEGKAVRAIEKAEPFNQVNAQVDTLCDYLAAAIGFIHTIGTDLEKTHSGISWGRCDDTTCKSTTRVLETHGHA